MVTIRCPHCGKSLVDIAQEFNRLTKENDKFVKLNRELAEEIEYLNGRFVASKNRHTFHRVDCMWAKYILSSSYLVQFSSHREAVEAGYALQNLPCLNACYSILTRNLKP